MQIAIALMMAILLSLLPSCSSKWQKVYQNTPQITLPVLQIETKNGEEVTSREEYIDMSLSLSGCEKEEDNVTLKGRIRGRGNSSWDFCEKKSYKLKLDLKVNLLDIGSGGEKDWALISNGREKSMLRNYAIFDLAKRMGMYPVTNSDFVTVYLNGDYIGVYLLTENIEVANHRLDIDDSGTQPDSGYLIELDRRAVGDAKSKLEYFYCNDWDTPFGIKSKVHNKEQNTFIKNYVEAVDVAILSGERAEIEKLVDLPSAVDMYIIEEFSKDRDVGYASLYMYKESGGKLTFCYPWDFDLALGNDSGEDRLAESDSPKINYKDPEGFMASVLNRWFAALMNTEWFQAEVSARWNELDDEIDAMISEVAKTGYSLRDEAKKNYDRFKIMGKKQLFEPYELVIITSYAGQVDYLLDWMTERKAWLDKQWKG